MFACLLAAAAAAAPMSASAVAAVRGRAPTARVVTLAVYPNPGVAGEPALVAGRVVSAGAADVTVTLWQRPAGAARATPLAEVSADANGAFVFTRAAAPLDQTASLYATALGLRSRSVREQVLAAVTLGTPTGIVTGASPVALSGRVLPGGHTGEPVLVQQSGVSGWQTIARATIASDGSFSASPTFGGGRTVTLRAVFPGDARNLAAASDPLDLLVEPAQGRAVPLVASANPLTLGQAVTLSGTLGGAGSGGTPVTLLAGPDSADEQPVASAPSDGAGNFSFVEQPTADTVYGVSAGSTRSAPLVLGVQATVTLAASTLSAPLGATQVIGGTVSGASAGGGVDLQLLGDDGAFHTLARGRLAAAGQGADFSFTTILTDPGSKTYRVLAAGDAAHQSGVSAPLTVVVSPRSASLVASALGQA